MRPEPKEIYGKTAVYCLLFVWQQACQVYFALGHVMKHEMMRVQSLLHNVMCGKVRKCVGEEATTEQRMTKQ